MLSKQRFLSALMALASLVCCVQAVWATCYYALHLNCCDDFTVNKDRTCGDESCPDVFVNNASMTQARPKSVGLAQQTAEQTVQNCCLIWYYTCVGDSCTFSHDDGTTRLENSATGAACDERGGGGGSIHPVEPIEPLDP